MGNFYLLVIDGLGVGALPDAHLYGDQDMNTLGHVCAETNCTLPNLEKMGLGNIIPLPSVQKVDQPTAAYGKMKEISAGKDSTTGHWEIAGIQMDQPFPAYPEGFPDEVIEKFKSETGVDGILCNKPYSGTDAVNDFGDEHCKTGFPIVYTSADSVFQVACHDDVVPVKKLYEWCSITRKKIMTGNHSVGRVIARPFTGDSGNYTRLHDQRHDFSMVPPAENIIQKLYDSGIKTYSIGKIIDLFDEQGFTQYRRTKSNAEGISQLLSLMSAAKDSFIFVNLIDTDQLYGHRLDPHGYASCLREFDRALPAILNKLAEEDVLIITGDHGNDPCSQSTDHSREYVPLLVFPLKAAKSQNLGIRETFSDIAVSAASFFNLAHSLHGVSFI